MHLAPFANYPCTPNSVVIWRSSSIGLLVFPFGIVWYVDWLWVGMVVKQLLFRCHVALPFEHVSQHCPWLACTVLCCPFIVWVHLSFLWCLPGCSFFGWALCIVLSVCACHVCMAAMSLCCVYCCGCSFPPPTPVDLLCSFLFAGMLTCCWWLHLCFVMSLHGFAGSVTLSSHLPYFGDTYHQHNIAKTKKEEKV